MSKIYKFNYHWLNELSKHKDMLDNDTGILVTYVEVLQQENKQLKEQLEILLEDNNQLEEIRIKAIECIKICGININTPDEDIVIRKVLKNILEILGDKEND